MKYKPPKLESQPLDNEVNQPKTYQGWQTQNAPQPKMTTPDASAFSGSYDAAVITKLTNMQTRILELETALVKLNFIKSR